MALQTIKTEVKSLGGMKVQCSAREFKYTIDEPENLGGTNEGMNPAESLLCALGACKCIVAKILSKGHKINLEKLKVEMEGEIDPDGFTGKNINAKIGFSKITTKYIIKTSNTREEINDFIFRVEHDCPMKDTIVNAPEMHLQINFE